MLHIRVPPSHSSFAFENLLKYFVVQNDLGHALVSKGHGIYLDTLWFQGFRAHIKHKEILQFYTCLFSVNCTNKLVGVSFSQINRTKSHKYLEM